MEPAARIIATQIIGDLLRPKFVDDIATETLGQLTLARFIERGELTRHLRRVRAIYPRRRDRLIGSLSRHLPQATPTGVRALNMLIDDAELERRRAAWTPPARKD